MDPVNLDQAFAQITEHWSPQVIARVNDSYVKAVKVKGLLTWHKHDLEDELFWVLRGKLRIEYEGGRSVDLGPGEMHVVPRGTMHNPVAEEECWMVLIEPVSTAHTGDVVMEKTRSIEQQLGAATKAT
jgi:mannose-6-phosphate isomerase-like protein (cupin superfamily)